MAQAKIVITAVILLLLTAELANSQTCSYMWDPVFETNTVNPPVMCTVSTTSGLPCILPFNYGGVTYTTCTIQGPNNGDFRPQCATSVSSNNTALTWSFCQVPTDAVIFYSTVRKGGYWTQNGGSTQGGTMLWIYGNRFAQNGFNTVPSISNSNTVQLVDGYIVYDCEMHNDKVTNTQLTCYAPALPESVYQIRVYVNGYLIPLSQYYDPNRALFASMPSQTPLITGITPQTGTPQSLITLSGSFQTSCYSRDVVGCSQDNNPLISRIYVGGHLCNVINQLTGTVYSNVTDTSLQCNFQDTEVGVFNITMLVTNQYGRSLASANLYRISANESLYTFQSYAVISSVTPNTGSTAGGTTLYITGNFFDNSATYPLVVNVAGQPCTVLNTTTTTIQCQTSAAPSSSQNQYQGGRGLQVYRTPGFTTQSTLSASSPPTPTGSQSWTDDALFVSNSSTVETVWLVGFIRPPKTATFTFTVNTNGAAALFLSTNDAPANKILITDATSNQSAPIILTNNTNYYLFAVGSRSSGYLQLGIQARMHETTLTATTSSLVLNEIQRIDVTATVTSEQQQFTYTTNSTNGTSEVQTLQVDSSTFQIGFRGVYTAIQTGVPTPVAIQVALNDLPSISPLSVSVSATSTLYRITFPVEMGDVPLLTCISTSVNTPIVIEVVQGIASGSKIAFELDGQLTNYIDFINTNETQPILYKTINNIFGIQCPPSINNAQITPSIVYLQDFESNCIYDDTPITTSAFCGQCALNGNTLVGSNTQSGNYLCFAYRIINNYVISINLGIQVNGDTTTTDWPTISFSPQADKLWHYTCINVLATLLSQSSIDSSVSSLVITSASLSNDIKNGIFLDVVSIRTVLPNGYEDASTYPVDQSVNSSCVFPFYYNGNSYSACTLDNNSIPICADHNNQTYQCKSSSIVGVRRLYPKHQLEYNTLTVTYSSGSSQITSNFRYSDCANPTLFVASPTSSATVTRLASASDAASGTFDLVFNGQTYPSIPVGILASDLANRLQSSSDFGFLNVTRLGDCTGYSYTIEWIANGGQKSNISITNTGSVTPAGTTVTATRVQSGGVLFNPLSGDLTRIYNTNPQVEVFVGGYPSQCLGNHTCDFQWLAGQTPTVSSVTQSSMTLTIGGTGFSTTASSNTVTIGTSGTCTVTSASATSLTCTIAAAPSGNYTIQVNVDGKGLATGTSSFSVTIPLQITSVSPTQGGAGGGYTVNVTGVGFSSSTSVTVDGSLCTNPTVTGFTLITCTVPPTASLSNAQVSIVVTSGSNTATLSNQFTYNVTNTPSISSSTPSVVTMSGGQITITGTNFGNSISVLIGTTQATVRSVSSTQITADLPSLPPGIYSVKVSTVNGFARPAIQIEYRFYVQTVSPQIGSLYGGSTVYIQGEGFDNTTTVSFTDGTNNVPCTVSSVQSNQIQCQTTAAAPLVIISSSGVDPTYGSGFSWSPQYATVQQGAVVQWQWGSSILLTTLAYKVEQVSNGYTTAPLSGGFNSGNASATGSFSYQFQTVGTYYYYTPPVDQSGLIAMRGVINVVAAQPQTLTVNVSSGSFVAQSCAFPFTFNSISYTACTTINDTQLWCSPTSVYTGQRLYCTPTATIPSSSCVSSTVISPGSCSQTVPSNVLQFLFTSCTIGTVTSISPVQGPAGTSVTITGTGFSTTTCQNIVLIGSSYQCPITTATTTQLVCQIGSNSSLNAKSIQNVNVGQDLQGFLSNNGLIQFQFQAKITNVSPLQGSIAGGTLVTIAGDGFTPADTRVIVGSIEYTSIATITYSQIQFVTQQPPSNYIDQTIPITILVGTNQAICSSGACTFKWGHSVTPYLTAVSPTSITGPQTLTLTGQNFAATGSISAANVQVTVNGQSCNVTSATNSTIVCHVGSTQAGNYSISVSINGVGTVVSSPILTSVATVSSVSPTSGSTYGGVVLTITGNGFASSASNIQVTVGASTCSIIQTTPGQIQCTVPAQGSNTSPATIHIVSNGITFSGSSTFTYSSASTPTISSVSPTSGTANQALTISGSNFVNGQTSVQIGGTTCAVVSVSSSSITCTVGSSPAGSQSVIVSVSSTGKSNANIVFQYALQVSSVSPSRGSYGGGQSVTVTGDGFNTSSISVTICGQACQSISALSNTQLTCITPSATFSSTDQSCNLTVTVGSLSQTVSYVYQANLTATVTSVSPTRGGTGGGTTLTIIGTNFPTIISAVAVSIAGVSCSVQSISSTTITCLTGSYSQTTIQAPVIVNVVNGGNAIGSSQFQYIDLWSSPWTWGGESPPDTGTIVSIDSGKTVYFDTTTPILKAIVIDNASLIFDDNQDVALNVEYILVVNGGRFIVGTETNPFQHKAVITMYGQLRSIELPIFGAKVLALRDGTVDMHGVNTAQTWTRLGATATAGSSQITLLQAVGWPVYSQIVIATTGNYLSQGETETRTITAISSNGLTLTLDSPLTNTHLGITQSVGSTSVEIRGEVGLLTHNVVFQGSVTATWNTTIQACPDGFNPGEFAVQTCFLGRYGQEIGSDQFGATIMASASADSSTTGIQSAILRLSNIEIFNAGQAFRLGRYPVHFHMNGNMSSSYIKSSSIHQTFNRAVNIHASHYVTVENNVAYNVMGGAMFLEDGVEIGNVLSGNLLVFVRTSSSLLNEDVTPAAIWVTNPNNIVENNAVAGGTHFGYWYRMLETPDGPSFSMFPGFCPHRQPFGRFSNNSVHSVGRFGVWIFPEYAPTVAGSCWNDAPYQAVFDGLISWGNSKGFEWVMSSTVQVKNAVVFDNDDTGIRCVTAINNQASNLPNLQATFYNENTGSSVINSIIIGDSGASGTPIVPGEGGLVVMWDRGLRVRNVSFFNFPSAYTQAIYGPFIDGRCVVYCGGWLTKFSQLSFTNVQNRGNFRWPYDGLYQDDDGSLSNVSGSVIISPDGLWNTSSACTRTPQFLNAITCPSSLGTWIRFAFNQANLGQNGEVLNVYDSSNHHTVVLNLHKRLTHPNGYMMTLLAKETYLFQFENANTSVNLSYVGTAYGLAPGDYLIILHGIEYMPDRVYTLSSTTVATLSTTPLTSASENGAWYYDNSTNLFSYIVKNPSSNTIPADVPFTLNVVKCRYPNCQTPAQPGLELPATARPADALYWSNDSDWYFATAGFGGYGSVKPDDYTQIYIPRGIWLVVDYPLPRILSLQLDGVLEFEQGMNNTLYADSILINGGQLIAGWPNNPLTSNVDIIITGSSSVDVLLPNGAGTIGPRVIGVLGGLDLHGIPHNVSWTRLASTASAGQTSVTLSEAVDWVAGDQIIFTTTDTRIEHVDRCTIANVTGGGTVLTLTSALAYTHIVIDNVFPNGEIYHVAGAVGLLTRNVRVINQSPASELFGFRVLVTDYATNIWDPIGADYFYTYYKGYARLSDTQFIGFGQFVDAPNTDKREAIHLYNLGDWNISRPTYVDSCSFDTGYYSAVGIWNTNGVPITNNVVYNTIESALVVTGQNNIIQNNLVSTVYWSGVAEPAYAEFNINYDGAIMSRDAISVIMRDNLVAGVQRIAYRIQGNSCPGTILPSGILNDYDNNEAHSTMSGVTMWPQDTGFIYDTKCVLIKGFKTYKTWYYGLYINTPHNIIVDSCAIADSTVGIFAFVQAISPLTHQFGNNSIKIQNSIVIGAITPNDCSDVQDTTTLSEIYGTKVVPQISPGPSGSRSGISFPYFSGNNMVPFHPWTSIGSYPAIDGLMTITNVTFGFFNDICSRRDIVIEVSQDNDDGQHPVTISQVSVYNTSVLNLIFNGRPNLDVVDPSDCVDMDCDGLKKDLLIDTDGTFFGQPATAISQADYLWGDQAHGVGDYRIPSVALSNSIGQMININLTYPYRGISRGPTCSYQPSYQMYLCLNTTDYRMLIIESMDSDTETRRLSPVAVMSDNGYIDLINGPQDHGWCNGYTCQKRISTFMALVESRHHYDIYLTSTTPNQIRFRLLNADSTIRVSLALYYSSLQQVDVYANDVYIQPTNRDPGFSFLMLLDQPNGVTLASPAGTNFFNRTTNLLSFLINGTYVIDLKISDLIVLTFGLPPTTPVAFYTTNVVANLAALLGVSPDNIRRVDIVSANNNTRVRRQTVVSTITLTVEIRGDPVANLSGNNTGPSTNISNICAAIINKYQSGQLQAAWAAYSGSGGFAPLSLSIQEPGNQSSSLLGVISRIVLQTPPSSCRLQSRCDVQPVIIAYDALGNIIDKLGSNDQPWQLVASIVGSSGSYVIGAIANYSSGQSQFTMFGVSATGSYQIQFTFITPYGCNYSFIVNATLSADTSAISVSDAILSAQQYVNIDVVSVNETFNLSTIIVDKISNTKIGNIQWSTFTWTAVVSLYTELQYQSNGSLLAASTSTVVVDTTAGTITATDLAISETGMYIIKVQIQSSNNVYSIPLTSNAILVKKNSTVLDVQTGYPTSNLTYSDDYYALVASGRLEITRCIIYNLLVFVLNMPITSNIVASPGSFVVSFTLNPTTIAAVQQTGAGVNNLTSSTGLSVSGMTLYSVNMNGQTSRSANIASSSGSSSSSSSYGQITNTPLIIGLVVGLVGGVLIIAGSIFGYRRYQKKQRGQRLIDEPDQESSPSNHLRQNSETTITRSKPIENKPNLTHRVSASSLDLPNVDKNRLHSPPANDAIEQRVPSAAMSITMLNYMAPDNQQSSSKSMPAVELIKFD